MNIHSILADILEVLDMPLAAEQIRNEVYDCETNVILDKIKSIIKNHVELSKIAKQFIQLNLL